MDELEQLRQENETLKKEIVQLKEILQTIADMNKSNEIGRYINQCRRAISISKLINETTSSKVLDIESLQKNIEQATDEKTELDVKIAEVIKEREKFKEICTETTETFAYTEMVEGIEIQSISMNNRRAYIAIPPTIQGRTVIGIAARAFQNNDIIVEVRLPDTIKYIGKEAFWGCSHLDRINLPESLESLGNYCFFKTALRKLSVPKSIKKIPYMCFAQCSYLETVILEDGIEYIGANSFMDTPIAKVVIPQSVQKIESGAFGKSSYSPQTKKIELYVIGANTEFDGITKNCRIFCEEGSKTEKSARSKKIPVKLWTIDAQNRKVWKVDKASQEEQEKIEKANYWKAYFADKYRSSSV